MEAALLVFTGLPLVHQYSTTGGFLHSFRLPALGMSSSDATYGDVTLESVLGRSSMSRTGRGDGTRRAARTTLLPERVCGLRVQLSERTGFPTWRSSRAH